MDHSRVQCPVCTLYLHSGMSLESHLDTHPKDQVIKALCSLSAKNVSQTDSRSPTPCTSERSYKSDTKSTDTKSTDDCLRWMGSQRYSDTDRHWRRAPSRIKSTSSSISNVSRTNMPDIRVADSNFDDHSTHNSQHPERYSGKANKILQTYLPTPMDSDYDQAQYSYSDTQDDKKEVKYSRSYEYASIDHSNNILPSTSPQAFPNVTLQANVTPRVSKKGNNVMKILPKPNLLLKTNVAGVQYISGAPGVKPLHVMMPTAPTFVQKNVQSNMIMTGSTIPCTTIFDSKLAPNQSGAGYLPPSTFTPGTTVVTQNSQIIYRETVHSLEGKPFISNMPPVLGNHNTVTNVAQTSSLYQNVMVLDQFGNASYMYPTPPLLHKPYNPPFYNEGTFKNMSNAANGNMSNLTNDAKKTLIIEVSPIIPSISIVRNTGRPALSPSYPYDPSISENKVEVEKVEVEPKFDAPGTSRGLKIISNIKVEVPVQHHKNMLNTVMDLTGSSDNDYPDRPETPERILPDLGDECKEVPIVNNGSLSNSFSVIKNIGNPGSSKLICDSKIETEFSDSYPMPDLICNEKPSISPCSELSELGDNSTDRPSISPKPKSVQSSHKKIDSKLNIKSEKKPPRSHKNNTLRLNNIFVKKNKKVLQIKNAKSLPEPSSSHTNVNISEPKPSSSSCTSPENFSMNRQQLKEKVDPKNDTLPTHPVQSLRSTDSDHHEFDADTEEQSMDIEPIVPSSLNPSASYNGIPLDVQVKEEVNTSNEGGFSHDADTKDESGPQILRPINVMPYGNMITGDLDEDSNHKELLDLEAASKNKQFVSMMNENYFGDNIYADYFTPDRGEAFDAEKESNLGKNGTKDGIYIWGEPSQKEGDGEYVLPNFIHDNYKMSEGAVAFSGIGGVGQVDGDGDKCERDSKADVLSESRSEGEVPLNICADERMPPRGELSGQESNGDMESPWSGMYTEMTPTEPYDLIARESWVSDGSDADTTEKRENLDEELIYPKGRQHTCVQCCARFPTLKELRAHRALAHAGPACSSTKTSYSRMVTARSIKKEEKPDDNVLDTTLATKLLALSESKPDLETAMLEVYDAMADSKPPIAALIRQEARRRRRDFVCPTCKVDQLNDETFHKHLKLHPLECLTCGKLFLKRASLTLHTKTHLNIRNYKCDICEKRFITRQKLGEHYNTHTGRTPFKCTMCDDTFRRYSNMVQHRDRHHFRKRAKVRDYVCTCGAVFHSRAKLLWHKETHDERPKACLYCSDKFVHAASLTRHVRRTHNEYFLSERANGKIENVPCPVCKQVYLRTNLRAHLLTHSGKRPHICMVCNKAFTTKWNLKLHRWTHASRSAKPYKCSLCKGAFIRHSEYVSHMNAHKSVRPYTCNYCGCQFIRKYNCQRHVREHEMAKKYVCKVPECGKSFHRSYYLSEHMKVHSGARPFSCNICGKTSSNKSNHNKHVKIHHAREPVATEA